MNCPPEIAKIVLQILSWGILMARSRGWTGEAEQAASEANHIHNLPGLLCHYKPELLDFYWNVERKQYIRECAENGIAITELEPLWAQLGLFVPSGQRRGD